METKDNLTDKKYFIENNRNNPIINNVLDNKTTIETEIENFYDIVLSHGLGGVDYTKNPNPEKSGKIPKDLLDMIEPFSEQGKLNSDFLNYERVREQVKAVSRYCALSVPAVFASMGLFISAVNADNYSRKGLAIGITIGLAGILSIIKLLKNSNKRKKTLENIEFQKLKKSIPYADKFFEKYRTYEELK